MAGYGSDEGFVQWASDNGHTIPDDAVAATLRQRGSAYLDAQYGSRFIGQPTLGVNQERAWPRTGAYVYGSLLPDDLIPTAVIHAAYEAAMVSATGSLQSGSQQVKRAKAGPVEVEYVVSETVTTTTGSSIPAIDGLLAPFLRASFYPAVFVV